MCVYPRRTLSARKTKVSSTLCTTLIVKEWVLLFKLQDSPEFVLKNQLK